MLQKTADMRNEQLNLENNLKALYRLKEIFRFQNIIIYILTFLVSTLSIKGEIMPFGLAMIAACVGETIPLVGVIISAFAGTTFGNGINSLLTMILVIAVYLFFVLFIKSKVAIDERNEEIKSGGKLFAACFLVSLIKSFIGVFLLYDVFMSTISAALTYVIYKIFVNGLVIIKDFNIKKVFTIEELISGCLIIALASMAFSSVTVFSLSISNIIIILMIMYLGWQNGITVGAVAGISIGLTTCLLDGTGLIQVLMFAISGVLSGALNKFGKIGVILGFILGNAILTYWVRGASTVIVYFREIFIASIGLLLIPKKAKIDIESIMGKERYIDNGGANKLEEAKNEEVSERLKTISKMFNSFMEKQEEKEFGIANIEQDFIDSLEEINDNMFYETISNGENGIARDICATLLKNDILLDDDLVEILKKHNNYIFIKDETIKNDLQEIVKMANRTLKVEQINTSKAQERKKNFEAINEGLKNVTNAIDKCADEIKQEKKSKYFEKEQEIRLLLESKKLSVLNCNIKKLENAKYIIELKLDYLDNKCREKNIITSLEGLLSKSLNNKITFLRERIDDEKKEYSQVYSSEDKYVLQVGSNKITKDGSQVSGDCSLQIKLADGKYLLAIADGMGTGEKAREYSKLTLRLIKQLLSAGFNREESIKLINSRLNLLEEAERYSSLDVTILDLYAGKTEILKSGACATYIKNRNGILKIESESMPLGIENRAEIKTQTTEVDDGEIIVMCSDGIIDSKIDDTAWLEKFLKNINTSHVQKIADMIMAEAIDNNYGAAQDDMTIIVSKIVKRK